jgi:hypothetical protein
MGVDISLLLLVTSCVMRIVVLDRQVGKERPSGFGRSDRQVLEGATVRFWKERPSGFGRSDRQVLEGATVRFWKERPSGSWNVRLDVTDEPHLTPLLNQWS